MIEGCDWKSQALPESCGEALSRQLAMHDRTVHPATTEKSTKLKIDPPKIGCGASREEWEAFIRQWEMYKKGTSLTKEQIPTALFYCCTEELRQDIMRDTQTDISSMAEEVLLKEMKTLAVREESILVHRMKLCKMTQSPGMGVRTFAANLKGQAALCDYSVKCEKEGCGTIVSYSREMIKDNLIRGLADPEILADLLGDNKINRTLEETINFVAQKEQGKATKSALGECTAATYSTPRQNTLKASASGHGRKCWACGNPSHGPKNDKATREKKCPAWTSKCSKCNIKGHFSRNCSKCAACGLWGHKDEKSFFCKKKATSMGHLEDSEEADRLGHREDSKRTDQLCTVDERGESLNVVNHHIFDGTKWIQRPSKPHPTVMITLEAAPQDHGTLGYPIDPTHTFKQRTIPMVADSGCQSCIMPRATAISMGYSEQTILPVSLSMRGAVKEDLEIMGGVPVILKTGDKGGCVRETKQIVYLSEKIERAFLCREAMIELGMIPKDFPTIPAYPAELCSCEGKECGCPKRETQPPPLQTCIPQGYQATEEDIPRLREWLIRQYKPTAFNTCENQLLPMMSGPPLKLHIDPNARPVAIHKPANVPLHWQEKVKADLDRDCRLGVLEKVDPNIPVVWCSRMVVTPKANGSPRRTVDLQPLNKSSVRQTHHTQSPFHLAEQIPQKSWKTVTDAWNGYHSVELEEADRHFTTFITPWGRYRYKVSPQGFLASGDGYTQRFDAIIATFPNKVKCVDDTCMWSNSIQEAFIQTCQWLDICARNGITLNPDKFQFCQRSVNFAGLTVTWENIKPNDKFLESVLDFPTPKDLTGARAWFGLVNQGAYAFSMAKEMQPYRHLLKPDVPFAWTDDIDELFLKSKQVIADTIKKGVRLYDLNRKTCLVTDWSNSGIGFMLKQKYCDCVSDTPTCCPEGWQLTLVGSRFTTPAESRYAPIEGEALAVVYGLRQTKYYTLGCPDLHVATDHKPLLGILGDKSLHEINNRRLLNLKEKTLDFSFKIHHVTGRNNTGPDAISRYPQKNQDPAEESEERAMTLQAMSTLNVVTNIISWDMVKDHTLKDKTLQDLITAIHDGFAREDNRMGPLKQYKQYADSLYTINGVVMLGQKIVIPASLREQVLDALHAAHQGVGAMCQRAADTVFWPGITADITKKREECSHCHRIAKSNPSEPPEDIEFPCYPMQKICADYFQHFNKSYLVVVDRYTNWPMVFTGSNTAEGLISVLRSFFATFGIAEELATDGGPQFTAEATKAFLESYQCRHRISSVGNPHSNCRAEIAVKTVKRMLMANTSATGSIDIDSFQRAMLVYRNSIDPETKASPACMLFGRPIRDAIPAPLGRYCPHPTWQETIINREKALAKRHNREREKWEQNTKQLPPLQVRDHVYLQNITGNHPLRWERTGVIVECRPHNQYLVRVDGSGRATMRNRKHLRRFTPFYEKTAPSIQQRYAPNAPLRENNPDEEGIDAIPERDTDPEPVQGEEWEAERVPPASPQEQPRQDTEATTANQQDSPEKASEEMIEKAPPKQKKLPLALRRLLPHNKAGKTEV